MSTASCRHAALPVSVARLRPLRRALVPTAGPAAAIRGPSAAARLVAQLHELKQFKVWDAPAGAAADRPSPAARGGRTPAPARLPTDGSTAPRPGAGGGRRPGVVWFRGDLRLHDNEALTRAQAECSSLVPVYCFDPRDYGRSPQGYDKTGPYRATFLIQAVADLRAALRAAGSELVVRLGRPEEVLPEVVRRTGAAAVYCHSEVTYEESRVEAAVKAAAEGAGAALKAFWGGTLCHLRDLPFPLAQLPQNFDKFRERAEGAAVRAALPAPSDLHGLPLGGRLDPGEVPTLQQLGLAPLPAGCTAAAGKGGRAARGGGGGAAGASPSTLDGSSRGGEREALRQLRRFVAQVSAAGGGGKSGGGGAAACGAAHGSNFASSIAPWLATGCLSPRRMLADVQAALGQAGGPAGCAAAAQHPLTWVRFELLWRDFFRFMTLKYSSLTAGQLGAGAGRAAPAAAAPALAAA